MNALERLARLHRVLVRYRDGFRNTRQASPETVTAALRELGAPIEKPADAEKALGESLRNRWSELAPPALVVWEGAPLRCPLRVAAGGDGGKLEWSLVLESGETREGTVDLSQVARACGEVAAGGERFVVKRFELPGDFAQGYHRLRLSLGDRRAETLVIAAPAKCFPPPELGRIWGVFIPLYALHSESSLGAGNFGDLSRLFEWMGELGGSLVGTLPLLAAFLDEPYEYSPYVPASRLFWNEFFLDPREAPEWERSEAARAELDRSGDLIAELRSAALVDYRRQGELQRRILTELANTAWADPQRSAELRGFVSERPQLEAYAEFRAAVEQSRTTWPHWPERMRAGSLEPGDFRAADRDYHLYVQWLCDRRLSDLARQAADPGLYLDLPLGVHAGGYDTWRNSSCYALGLNGGAPPDRFFTKGQNWGFAPLHPEAIRRDGYRHVIDIVRHHLRYAGVLRVDHFMWLHRLYWIPRGAEASEGTYVEYRADELYAILAIESHRAKCLIVGEDLGTVPKYVQARMTERGIDRIYVAQFSFRAGEDAPLRTPPSNALASVNTHDTPTWAAFWAAEDVDDQVEMGLLSDAEANAARASRDALRKLLAEAWKIPEEAGPALEVVLEQMARSDARGVLVTLEDLWGEKNQQNTPGTGAERPNWRRRARLSLEQMRQDERIGALLQKVREGREAN